MAGEEWRLERKADGPSSPHGRGKYDQPVPLAKTVFKCNIQVMEAMARKEAGESLNKRPSQSQAQVSELNLLWSKLFCELL